MKCDYCGHDIKNGDKFCSFCGAKMIEETKAEEKLNEIKKTSEEKKTKKKLSPGKIIFIVFLISTIVVVSIAGLGMLAFKFLSSSDIFDDNGTYEFTEDEFEERYEDYFDNYFDPKSSKKDSYKGTDKFKAGTVDYDNNTYSSDFLSLKFQLPVSYEIYTSKELESLYDKSSVSSTLVENNLFCYDLFAEDTISGTSIYISLYNADYFDEYDDLDDFNDEVKDATEDYADSYGVDVDYAKDSKITFGGIEYNQFAARITGNATYYQYDFTTLIDGYYVQISITADDIETVGTLIDLLS